MCKLRIDNNYQRCHKCHDYVGRLIVQSGSHATACVPTTPSACNLCAARVHEAVARCLPTSIATKTTLLCILAVNLKLAAISNRHLLAGCTALATHTLHSFHHVQSLHLHQDIQRKSHIAYIQSKMFNYLVASSGRSNSWSVGVSLTTGVKSLQRELHTAKSMVSCTYHNQLNIRFSQNRHVSRC